MQSSCTQKRRPITHHVKHPLLGCWSHQIPHTRKEVHGQRVMWMVCTFINFKFIFMNLPVSHRLQTTLPKMPEMPAKHFYWPPNDTVKWQMLTVNAVEYGKSYETCHSYCYLIRWRKPFVFMSQRVWKLWNLVLF